MFGRLIREPLVQFLLVGIALFGGWRLVTPAEARRDDANRIVITEDDLKQMRVAWMAQGMPPPTLQQLQGLIEERVHEEVLYREALALGMDKDDVIVRRQLARKMEFVAEDLSRLDEPTPQQLNAWFDQHASQFALPARVTFRHVYFSPDRRGASARADADPALPLMISTWSGHSQSVNSLAFSPDGTRLVSSSDDTLAQIVSWDISSAVPKKTGTINGHSLGVTSVLFDQSNSLLLSGSRDSTIMLWNPPSTKRPTTACPCRTWSRE